MRAILAPGPTNERRQIVGPSGRLHETLQLTACAVSGADGGPARVSLTDVLREVGPDWRPDAFLYWSIEYHPVPEGVEDADCFTAAVVGDWNLGAQAFQTMGAAFDLLIADHNGCERLRAAGFPNVMYWPLWMHDPTLHRVIPSDSAPERDIDILLVGSFNHDVQRERAKWLARVAKLSRRYRVHLTCGVYGEEYARLMNRARIVFNRSIRGEINMRAYEAPACGALMFYERGNPEIGSLLEDRKECVLYADDLEELLDHYLTHEDERRAIAEAGRLRVQRETLEARSAALLDRLDDRRQTAPRTRAFTSLPPAERLFRRAYQRLTVPVGDDTPHIRTMLEAARRLAPERADIPNASACLHVGREAASAAPGHDPALRAVEELRAALALQPDHAAARLNLGRMYLEMGRTDAAAAEMERVIALCRAETCQPQQFMGPYLPRTFEAFNVEVERVWGLHAPGTPEWTAAMRGVLRWSASEALSDLEYAAGRYLRASELARAAMELRPELGATRYRLARALRALGRVDEAAEQYRAAMRESPFCRDVWEELARLLLDTCRRAEGLAHCDEVLTLLDACPVYADARPMMERLRAALAALPDATPPSPVCRLLAFPDWRDPDDWRPLVARYVREHEPGEPVSLLLRVDPALWPRLDAALAPLERFLTEALRVAPADVPDIELLHQPIAPEDAWQLYRQADALLLTPATAENELMRARAEAAEIEIVAARRLECGSLLPL